MKSDIQPEPNLSPIMGWHPSIGLKQAEEKVPDQDGAEWKQQFNIGPKLNSHPEQDPESKSWPKMGPEPKSEPDRGTAEVPAQEELKSWPKQWLKLK